jgi:hypothetical protein
MAADRPPGGAGWLHEIKFDGFRLFAQRRGGVGARLLTRNGHDWTDRYPSVLEALNALKITSSTAAYAAPMYNAPGTQGTAYQGTTAIVGSGNLIGIELPS